MPKKEKKGLLILILVAIIGIAIMMMVGRNKGEEGGSVQVGTEGQGTTVQEEKEEEKYVTQLADGTKLNNSEELNTSKTYGNLKISNIQFTERNGMTVLLADVTNTGSTKHEIEIVKITIIGENGEEITTIKPIIGEIEAGGSVQINASITADVVNARDFRIEAAQ